VISTSDYSSDLTIITIDTTLISEPDELEVILVEGVLQVVQALTSSSHARGRRVGLDLRAHSDGDILGAQATVIGAIQGLMQGYVREAEVGTAPVNLVLSDHSQSPDREATWAYLAAADGTMARGATFDLREPAR
jgi:hypothetical protein